MSASTTQVRRGSWGEVLAVLAVILGMLVGFGVVTAAPADAVEANCSAEGNSGTPFDMRRLVVELDEGAEYLDTDVDAWTCGNGDLVFTGWTGVLHVSCSEDLTVTPGEVTRTSDGTTFTITDFWLDSRNVNPQNPDDGNRGDCQPEDTFPDPSVTLLKVNDNDAPLAGASFLLDGDTDYPCTSDDQGICDFGNVDPGQYTLSETSAPDGYEPLTLTEAQASVLVTFDSEPLELGSFVNTPTPEEPTFDPAITLLKSPFVGDGSDLVNVDGPNPLLQFSESDGAAQTALYTYVITNTGDEPLKNLVLTDSRDGVVLDMGDCPEVLEVDAFCTATGAEEFTLAQAEGVVAGDGTVTNTGTVIADGEESGDEVTDTDPATIAFSIVAPTSLEKEDPDPAPTETAEEPAPATEELPAAEVESAAAELPATGLDREGLLPLSLLLIAMGAAILWLDRPWVGVR